jgi:thiol-disulfide isomerase/thioredoxin
MRPTLLILGLLLAAFAGGCQGQVTNPEQQRTADDAPSVPRLNNTDTLPYPVIAQFDDLAHLFSSQSDTVYVINFWATWCAPCVAELPYFEKLADETTGQPVQLVMVSLDFQRDIRTKLYRFVKDRPLHLPVVVLADDRYHEWIDRVDPEWTGAIPITLIYKGAERRFFGTAFASYEELESAVRELL